MNIKAAVKVKRALQASKQATELAQNFFRGPDDTKVGKGARTTARMRELLRILGRNRSEKIQVFIYVLSAPSQDTGYEVVCEENHGSNFF